MAEEIKTVIGGAAAGTALSALLWFPAHFGFTPRLAAFPLHTSIFFSTYEKAKQIGKEQNVHPVVACIVGCTLGELTGSFFCFPLEIIFGERQDRKKTMKKAPTGFGSIARHILKNEGLTAFYSGYMGRNMANVPSTVLLFSSYEYFKTRLNQREDLDLMEKPVFQGLLLGLGLGAITGFVITPLHSTDDVVSVNTRFNRTMGAQNEIKMFCEEFMTRARKGVRRMYSGGVMRTFSMSICGGLLLGTYELVKSILPW